MSKILVTGAAGVIARPSAAGFGSAFMSEWPRAADTLMHAAGRAATGVLQPPALRLTAGEVLEAAVAQYGENRREPVSFRTDARIEAIFGRQGELRVDYERGLGFEDDGDAHALLRAALAV